MSQTVLKVGGMSCQGCVRSVTGVLSALPGVAKADVSLERGEATIEFEPERVSREELVAAVDAAGFTAS